MLKKTDEEKFLFKAYEIAFNSGDLFHELNAYDIGGILSQREHKIKIIIQHLAKAGFIRKRAENFFILTQKAIDMVKND